MSVKPILESMRTDAEKIHLLLSHAMERDFGPNDVASLRELLDNLTLRFAELRNGLDPAAGGQNLEAATEIATPADTQRGNDMISERLSPCVEIRARDAERAEIVIEVQREGDEFDTAAILARAWACLAEAINDHKAAVEAGRTPVAADAGQAPAHAPGSGAWWEG